MRAPLDIILAAIRRAIVPPRRRMPEYLGIAGVVALFALLAIIGACVAAPDARASWLASQTWQWNAVPGATAYRLYWKAARDASFCANRRIEFPVSVCTASICHGDITGIPSAPRTYIVVTAVKPGTHGELESVTEHGPIWECAP